MRIFDAHLHVIDPRFPLVQNQGYLPAPFTCADYVERVYGLPVVGGVVVSGSFQAFDQQYLVDALARLGPSFVGVTQLPQGTRDADILRLDGAGVRGVRFNLRRREQVELTELARFAARVHEVAGWHVELYVDGSELPALVDWVRRLPAVSIDHLGLSREALPSVVRLAEANVRVKASGFGRLDFDARDALRRVWAANPAALIFGTDLPSTRAPRPFSAADVRLVVDTFDAAAADRILWKNAADFYRLRREAHGQLHRGVLGVNAPVGGTDDERRLDPCALVH